MSVTRAQYSLKTLLWLMIVVAAFFAGKGYEQQKLRLEQERTIVIKETYEKMMSAMPPAAGMAPRRTMSPRKAPPQR